METKTYLSTSPDKELRTLNTTIVNIRKWLRGRQETLKRLLSSDSNKRSENDETVKKLIFEARKQQEEVDVLLDRGDRYLSQRANIVLEVDLENLAFLWNSYTEGLRKLYTPPLKKANTESESSILSNIEIASTNIGGPKSSYKDLSASAESDARKRQYCEIQSKETRKDRSSSFESSFVESGSLCLEDLGTPSSVLTVDELTYVPDDQVHPNRSDSNLVEFCATTKSAPESICQNILQDDVKCELSESKSTAQSDTVVGIRNKEMAEVESLKTMEASNSTNITHQIGDASASFSPIFVTPSKGESEISAYSRRENELLSCPDGCAKPDAESPSPMTPDVPGTKNAEMSGANLPSDAKRRRVFLDTSVNTSNLSSRSESPLSLDSSRSATPTGTLSRADRQGELWKAIGSIDCVLMDKDIIEACKSTEKDLFCDDEDLASTPSVSFTEFLQQYRELTDWLNQIHKVTQREVTSLSEKYLNQSYHEEMLERSPRREFLNNYSRQLLLRYPNMSTQISARMARLNTQWAAVEQAIAPKHGTHDLDTMSQDLECDLNSLRRWLNAIEARLLPMTIKADWTDAELEERLQQHQLLQRDIESHNKIVNAVLKLSERLEAWPARGESRREACETEEEEEEENDASLQLVALNLERRWHGIWLQSLEWQCRLEEALAKRKGFHPTGFDFSSFSLPILDESLLSQKSQDLNEFGLIELEDDSLLFIGHRCDVDDASSSFSESEGFKAGQDRFDSPFSEYKAGSLSPDPLALWKNLDSGASTPQGQRSPTRPSASFNLESPVGKRPFPDGETEEASPAKRGSPTPSSSSGGLSPLSAHSPVDILTLSHSGEDEITKEGIPISDNHEHNRLKVKRALFDRSSGDSANISEAESKMGDSPPGANNPLLVSHAIGGGRYAVTSSDGEHDPPQMVVSDKKVDVKDIGYSSESQSNDEVEMMMHQIDMEYKFPGKCEVANDAPFGEKVKLPSVPIKTDYYCMTHIDSESTDKTDNGDTDSGPERFGEGGKLREFVADEVVSDEFQVAVNDVYSELMEAENPAHVGVPEVPSDVAPVISQFGVNGNFPSSREKSYLLDSDGNIKKPMHEILDFSESDSAPESKQKKSIQYLIEHAEDLVKPSSPKSSSSPSSPVKHHHTINQHRSPSKQTQTEACSTVESSCDASGEDNSDHEVIGVTSSAKDDFSTATDDAEETICGSIVNLDSATESARNTSADDMISPVAQCQTTITSDSPRLRKHTGDRSKRKGKADRPWSVGRMPELNAYNKTDIFSQVASSESAIDHLHCHTDTDSCTNSTFHTLNHSSTFPRENRRTNFRKDLPTSDRISSTKSARRKSKCSSESIAGSAANTIHASNLSQPVEFAGGVGSKASDSEYSPTRGKRRKARRQRHRSGQETVEVSGQSHVLCRSSATESYDSAEAESESETADEYLTAPMDAATSDHDDVHNVSGSFSENSSWDNYQMVYPTASEDPGEELLTWDPQDDLEYEDDFHLTPKSLVTDLVTKNKPRTKLKFTKQGILCEDSDSDLEDFHYILEQSEQQLRLADQSLKKKRKDPMGTGLHPHPAKYGEIMATCETNIQCLESICRHLKSEDVTEDDVNRVQDLMHQWKKLYALASERCTQTTVLSTLRDTLAAMTTCIDEAENCLPFDRFSSEEELKDTIQMLKDKKIALERQEKQLEVEQKKLKDFSVLNPMLVLDKYFLKCTAMLKSTSSVAQKLDEHLGHLENNWSIWVEYLDSQKELDSLLSADRERLHRLLSQKEQGRMITKKDVLMELETLQSNLSMYESKLSVLQAMRSRLMRTSDDSAQRNFLASLADLRNQLFVVSERCREIYRDIEDDEELPLSRQTDFGNLAMSAASLHELLNNPTEEWSVKDSPCSSSQGLGPGVSRCCLSWLRSLPVQVVSLVLVAGLVYALDPDILDRLTSFTLTITPELHFVNGPPTM